ncbi:DUF3299 domain-containing protein [bacterium]|nr:DUF3299 domain-containing protein [bacterium]
MKKRKKKNGNGAIVFLCLILACYLIAGYWKKFKEIDAAEKTDITFEETPSPTKPKQTVPESKDDGIPRLGWKDLEGLDYLTGKISPEIQKLNNHSVKIPGYIVPLTDDLDSFNEFLIVPNPQACIHFPPPPPNQMLYVKTKKNLPISITFYPFWFQGKLETVSTISEFGKVGYRLTLQRLEAYKAKQVM